MLVVHCAQFSDDMRENIVKVKIEVVMEKPHRRGDIGGAILVYPLVILRVEVADIVVELGGVDIAKEE